MRDTKTIVHQAAVVAAMLVAALVSAAGASASPPAEQKVGAVVEHYADIAQAAYSDAEAGARKLQSSVDVLLAHPSPDALAAARAAWKEARIPYLQTEGFRFANTVVDDWEPRVNAWPLDEGLIDYVAPSYGTTSDQNPLYTLNVIGNTKLRVGAKMIDATTIDQALLRQLQEAEGVQTNVSTGYHAIEFLLWGQNLNGLGGGHGERPASDFDVARCTHGNCARRAAYLKAAVDMLVSDLDDMAADWKASGKARAELLAKGADGGLAEILTGLGSLTFGEMAGERMKLGLMLHDPEEQQDCFSNNTHNSHYYDEIGIGNLWRGRYVRNSGQVLDGASVRDYAMAVDPASATRLDHALDNALAAIKVMKDKADSGGMAYSQMIAAGNADGNKIVSDAMDMLVAQTRAIEGVAAALHVTVSSNKSDHSAGTTGLR
ncbi:MAG TPA: imelysin family protein [Rhizomicrobium sp.]|nr:imelysin family protein [Rhizomicrobium sp.]